MQLFFDGSQAAICGTVLVLPFALAGWEAIRGGGFRDLAIVGLLGAALFAAYPLFAPAAGGASALVLLWLAFTALRRRIGCREALRHAWWRVAVVLALAAGLSSVAFARDVRYWHAVLTKTQAFPVLGYHFSLPILPPWLLQTGEFANLPNFVIDPTTSSILKGAVVPALLVMIIGVGLARRRVGFALAGFILVAAGLAVYVFHSQGCQYCIDRNLLPVMPAATVLVALGIGSMAVSASRRPSVIAVGAALLVIVPTALATRTEHQRFREYDYFLGPADRALAAVMAAHPGPVELEGFNENVSGPSEYAAVYDMLVERGLTVSASVEASDYIANAYMAPNRPPGPEFHPGYRYVLTRLGAVATDRPVVARAGGLALERRTATLDVTPYSGLGLPLQRLDPGGIAWVAPELTPLRFYVVGGTGHARVWVHVTLHTDVPLTLEVGIRWRAPGGSIAACVPATGSAPIRRVVLYMSGQLNLPPLTDSRYSLPMPVEDIQLTGMRAETGHCTL